MTTIISLYGGPGSGKSTTAAGLFYHMKLKGINVELVNEYVKKWAWYNRKPSGLDQIYITGKQIHSETLLYGKVDYIVTDSPIWLGSFYEQYYAGSDSLVGIAIQEFMNKTEAQGIKRCNYFLRRNKEYNPIGRFQTEEEAIDVDNRLKLFMGYKQIPYLEIEDQPELKVKRILNILGLDN